MVFAGHGALYVQGEIKVDFTGLPIRVLCDLQQIGYYGTFDFYNLYQIKIKLVEPLIGKYYQSCL
jgi:hypothetical protein